MEIVKRHDNEGIKVIISQENGDMMKLTFEQLAVIEMVKEKKSNR